MQLKTRLVKLEKQAIAKNDLFNQDLTKLTDEELEELKSRVQEESARSFGRKKAEAFTAWIESLPEDELDRLINDTSYLISEEQRLGLS